MQIKQKKENDTHTHTSILGVAKVLQHFLFHLYLGWSKWHDTNFTFKR